MDYRGMNKDGTSTVHNIVSRTGEHAYYAAQEPSLLDKFAEKFDHTMTWRLVVGLIAIDIFLFVLAAFGKVDVDKATAWNVRLGVLTFLVALAQFILAKRR